jgi:hypothetical protein
MLHQTEIAYRQERLLAEARATRPRTPSLRTPRPRRPVRAALHRLHPAW